MIWRRQCAFDSFRRSPRFKQKKLNQLIHQLTHLRVRWTSERRPGGTTGGTQRRSSDTVFRVANISSSDSNSSSWLCVPVSTLIFANLWDLCVFGIELNLDLGSGSAQGSAKTMESFCFSGFAVLRLCGSLARRWRSPLSNQICTLRASRTPLDHYIYVMWRFITRTVTSSALCLKWHRCLNSKLVIYYISGRNRRRIYPEYTLSILLPPGAIDRKWTILLK